MNPILINSIFTRDFNVIGKRILIILAIALAAHLLVLTIKWLSRIFHFRVKRLSSPKLKSVSSLFTSILIFIIYFLAFGYALKELGISLTAYIASASVIGLAVGFGSQGIVQDMVTGFTLIIANQIDIGDMVEINGQTGIITSIGMRFVVFENAMGASVHIPNRNISVVINYPKKYINCYIDIRLPGDSEIKSSIKKVIESMLISVPGKYPKILISPKPQLKTVTSEPGREILRIIYKIWPGRGGPIETSYKNEILHQIKKFDPGFLDWMVSVNYEIEKETVK